MTGKARYPLSPHSRLRTQLDGQGVASSQPTDSSPSSRTPGSCLLPYARSIATITLACKVSRRGEKK